uniref:EML-like second beta-propeller domain-containing protein n=1 Tax=Globisporangium ultimum (strain ATCC 200006 / CBS 805.95 / DAOM BR144) TaxID=431595 RepID=K3X439_GLOUD
MEKRVDGLQLILATQQKQQMYERALVRFPQCRSNVLAPSIYDGISDAAGSTQIPAPQSILELDFVYGMHTSTSGPDPSSLSSNSNCSNGNNIFYLSTGEVLWFTATLVVLYTKESNTQRYFREHTNEVTSVGVHPNQYIVASGQAGRQTHLLVWNAKDEPLGKRFTCLPGHSVAVRAISFSHDGKLIASLGGDMYNTICVHDWKEQSLLVTARGHSFRVHTVAFNPFQAYGRPETRRAKKPGQALNDDDVCYTLVSCGVRHIRFWTLTKTKYVAPTNEASEDFAFHGSAFGSPARLRPPTPHAKMWKLEGNVPSFHGRLDVQDFTCLTFVDDSPPVYIYDDQAKELVATNYNDHTLGRIIAGTAKGDLCVFYQPRRSPEPPTDAAPGTMNATKQDGTAASGANEAEPAKWWEIPDEYTDAEINALVLERIEFEPTARLVEVVPHDQETGNRFKLTKQTQAEIDGITKRLTLKPNSAVLHARLSELRYGGPVAHNDAATQRSVRVPGVNTLGVFTPLTTGTFSEGSHQLMPVDQDTLVFQLPTTVPGENNSGITAKPTSLQWKDDGKFALVGTSSNCLWEINITTGEWKLVFEARSGAVVACSCHPGKEEVVTVSLDGYVCIWDLKRHCCKRRMHLGSHTSNSVRAACMDFQPFGDELAIGMTNGELAIIGYHELKLMVKKTIKPHAGSSSTVELHSGVFSGQGGPGGGTSISQLKYCPKGNFLAVGAKDTFVYLYDIGNNYKRMHVCEGHSSAITQLTWSAEGDLLQSNASDGELLYWSISHSKTNTKQITDAFLVRDAQWVKWTCAFGWPTPGIWSEDTTSLVDIAAVTEVEQQQP